LNSVGIGTSNTQGYKLAVKGAALFTRIQVKAIDKWPDYVFGKGYRLRSLEDLENYVRKYKHLPEVVTAARVGKEGIDMAAAQGSILKKVEELTLYLIDENKQLKEQNRQITEQNARLQQLQCEVEELKKLIRKS
ncbi:MAG TPA: hypothetical protein VI233_17305, partial [Puia sp.]